MIKAVLDKLVVQDMKRKKTKSGLIIPDSVQDPQTFGVVLSIGEKVEVPTKVGDIIAYNNNAGMAMLMEGKFFRCIMENEIYCILESQEVKDQLYPLELKQKDMDEIDSAFKEAQAASQGGKQSRIVRV